MIYLLWVYLPLFKKWREEDHVGWKSPAHPDDVKLYKTVHWFVLQQQQHGKKRKGNGGGEDVQMKKDFRDISTGLSVGLFLNPKSIKWNFKN